MTMNRFWSGVTLLVRIDMAIFIAGTAALLIWVSSH
jgi:hypothetical protein